MQSYGIVTYPSSIAGKNFRWGERAKAPPFSVLYSSVWAGGHPGGSREKEVLGKVFPLPRAAYVTDLIDTEWLDRLMAGSY